MHSRDISIPVVLLAFGLSAPAAGTEIYHWVDQNGVQHFSQTAPASETAPVEKMTLEDTPPVVSGTEGDIYNVAATAERTQALREEMDKRREERLERERRQAARPVQQSSEPVRYAAPWLWNRPGNPGPPGRPPRPPRPPKPPTPEPIPPSTYKPPGGDTR
ncbi:MAG: DUF4124 domain-containing protein [Lysobacterales bacterium]|jgi:hypothetical protein